MRGHTAAAAACIAAARLAAQAPSAEEQSRLIEQTRRVSMNYTKSLPDFLCTQFIRRSMRWPQTGEWAQLDTLTVQVTYFQHKEDYKLVQHNSHDSNQSYASLAGATTRGEFGSTLRGIFDPPSRTVFEWKEWGHASKRKASVYTYRVASENSHFELNDGVDSLVAGYHGLLFIEPETAKVLRVTIVADIPESFPIRESNNSIDYNYVKVDGRDYLLPVRAETEAADVPKPQRAWAPAGNIPLRLPQLTKYLNVTEFRSYRKFAVDAQIKFDTPEDATTAGRGK